MTTETNTTLKASELRIGNWIEYGGAKQISSVNADSCCAALKGYKDGKEVHIHNIEPIPLTPELLEKAGFKKVDTEIEEYYYLDLHNWHGDYKLAYFVNEDITCVTVFHAGAILGRLCIYLHQLQNLYFALTGEELDINL